MDESNGFRRALKSPVVVGGLCLLAGVAMYANFSDSRDQAPTSTRMSSLPPNPIPSSGTSSTSQLASHEVWAAKWAEHPYRDPFAPLTQDPSTVSGEQQSNRPGHVPSSPSPPPIVLVLKAVAMDQEKKRAVINRTIVHEGDRVEGFLVVSIEAKGVWLEQHGTKQFLTFRERKMS